MTSLEAPLQPSGLAQFFRELASYDSLLNDTTNKMLAIHRNFTSFLAPFASNVPEDVLVHLNKDIRRSLSDSLPKLHNLFRACRLAMEQRETTTH